MYKRQDENGLVVDPFGGSGTFAYAALDAGRHVRFNEWEPYAYKMSTAPFRGVPSSEEYCAALRFIAQRVEPTMNAIYKTRCPNCGAELSFDGLFFDREPLEYYHPTQHERLGANGGTSAAGNDGQARICFFDHVHTGQGQRLDGRT